MSTTLNHAMGTAKDAIGSAKEVIDSAKGGAEHAASSAHSSFLDIAKFALNVVTTLRGFDRDDALGLVGLARKRNALSVLPAFGIGIAVGAGIGLLFAPMSGASLRRKFLRGLDALKSDASDTIEKAGDEVMAVERKVEKKVGAVADAVKNKIEAAEGGIKDAFTEGKSGTSKDTNAAGNGDSSRTSSSKTHGGSDTGRSVS